MARLHPREVTLVGLSLVAPSLEAATLPAHSPLSIVVVADAVNPNGLSPADLTEPADFAPALTAAESGISVSEVITVDSQCVDEGMEALGALDEPTVLLYFAHRAAKRCNGQDAQAAFVDVVSSGLTNGLGVVVFHHGLYGDLYTPGAKDSLLQLIGAKSSGIAWDTTVGQRVFIVGGEHFVARNGLPASGREAFLGTDGVPSGQYPYFDNVPDERYPTTELLTEAGETRVPLFATNSGGERLLGYALARPGWTGRVVAYQPGEYQPNALDDRAGNNFQILANALYFAAYGEPDNNETTLALPSSTTEVSGALPGSFPGDAPTDDARTNDPQSHDAQSDDAASSRAPASEDGVSTPGPTAPNTPAPPSVTTPSFAPTPSGEPVSSPAGPALGPSSTSPLASSEVPAAPSGGNVPPSPSGPGRSACTFAPSSCPASVPWFLVFAPLAIALGLSRRFIVSNAMDLATSRWTGKSPDKRFGASPSTKSRSQNWW